MVYQVRLNYGIKVEAATSAEAYRKAAGLIKKEPGIALRGVEAKEHRSIWKMLIFGY